MTTKEWIEKFEAEIAVAEAEYGQGFARALELANAVEAVRDAWVRECHKNGRMNERLMDMRIQLINLQERG